jgi:toxin ParE1/3/4
MTQSYRVELTEDAQTDLNELVDYVAQHDAPLKALQLLDQIESTIASLQVFPERGAQPKELLALGNREYRETYCKPYRILYKVLPTTVYVYLIADGRRDLRSLLARRVLQS